MITRRADWPVRLADAIKAAERRPFAYGTHDCCTAAAGLILAMTDEDIMRGWRGRYRSAAGAARLMRGGGGLGGTAATVMAGLNAAQIAPAMAGLGDLVLSDRALADACGGRALGICIGAAAIFPGDEGWVHLPVLAAVAAWRI